MRAVLCETLGEPSVLKIVDVPVPQPKAGEVLVRARAAALNFPDVLMVAGGYQHKPALPFIPGMEAAGEIAALGDGVAGWSVGDRVIFGKRPGCFAEYVVVPVSALSMRVPANWSFAEGAAFRVGATTAYNGLVHRAGLKSREVLLVHGATGGVGMAAVQLGKHLGAQVIATGGDDAKLEVVRAQGADVTINYRSTDFVPLVKSLSDGRGADVVYDPVGGDTFERSLRCAAFGARLLVIGFTSGNPSALKSNHILIKCLSVIGVRAGEHARHHKPFADDYDRELPRLAAQGVMRPHISHRFALEQVVEAMGVIQQRQVVGKAILEI
ncbi:NADPH:quinone oxidoreductase family protein [Reyranella sp. CPCC 100927]|uniref:NADPH:quinone oxidoreductase family protein n=1 Tax=Reyranella sp. CPCC 100927 TaxID=2599616 RepID=UPI0011B43991|nr:NADPH:quinone oxidoreductase family protein [Reyranella sp. CPCC 100927]TWT15770.1 NADPH:quinone oxidoreductase family protein [Reyranella sp. CPCC 100927]